MIISITNMKGGVGKSTITQNLAVCFAHKGYKTCIVDTDYELQTSTKWAAERADDLTKVVAFAVKNDELSKRVLALKKEFDLIFIDGTPALFELSTRAIILSDLVILPILPSIADIWTLEKFVSGYEEARSAKESMGATVSAYVLLNKFNENLNLDKEAIEVLKGFDIPVLSSTLGTRIAYRESMPQGRGVIEYKDKKAKEEMSCLADELEKIMKK
ncbi:MAG: ParA family protein [Saprospiraceae bacterium]|nr:ParA family protein [Saprospiraceae bacterium]